MSGTSAAGIGVIAQALLPPHALLPFERLGLALAQSRMLSTNLHEKRTHGDETGRSSNTGGMR